MALKWSDLLWNLIPSVILLILSDGVQIAPYLVGRISPIDGLLCVVVFEAIIVIFFFVSIRLVLCSTSPKSLRNFLGWKAARPGILFAGCLLGGFSCYSVNYAWQSTGQLILPDIEIQSDKTSFVYTQHTALTVALTPDIYNGIQCDWMVDGKPESPECDIVFQPSPGETGQVEVSVKVLGVGGLSIGKQAITLQVNAVGIATIQPHQASAYPGEQLKWSGYLDDDQTDPSGDQCQWTSDISGITSLSDCQADVTLDDTEISNNPHTLTLKIMDKEGHLIEKVNDSFTVKDTPKVYYEYVIDASRRMSASAGPAGDILQTVVNSISDKAGLINSGYFGVYLFGDLQGPSPPCADYRELLPIGSLAGAALTVRLPQELQSIQIGGSDEAPLNSAVAQAFKALLAASDTSSTQVLAVFTYGPGTCPEDNEGLGDMLEQMLSMNPINGVRTTIYDYHFLPLTVAIAFTQDQREEWSKYIEPFQSGDYATPFLIASSPQSLDMIEKYIISFSAPHASISSRTSYCDDLVKFAASTSVDVLYSYCARLAPKPE